MSVHHDGISAGQSAIGDYLDIGFSAPGECRVGVERRLSCLFFFVYVQNLRVFLEVVVVSIDVGESWKDAGIYT